MSPIVLFQDWLLQFVSTAGYQLSRGMWDESSGEGKRYVCLWVQQGRRPMAGVVEFPQIRILVVGSRSGRSSGDTPVVEAFAQSIIDAALTEGQSSCLAGVAPLGSIMGPYYSEQNRPWYEINLELTI